MSNTTPEEQEAQERARTVAKSLFAGLYEANDHYDSPEFGEHWCRIDPLPHAEWVLVAKYEKPEGSDGLDVDIYCCAMPARFYHLVAKDGSNSCDETVKGFELSTGTGCAKLMHDMAEAISQGMLARPGKPIAEKV